MPNKDLSNLGLVEYLNATKEKHHNLGFDNFKDMVKNEVNVANLARAFGVTRPTVHSWLKLFKQLKEAN